MYLTASGVIVDIVDTVKPVRKNEHELTVLCKEEVAQGYIGSDNETIYAKAGKQLIPAYTDIQSVVSIDEGNIPEEVKPLAWAYKEGKFVENEDGYPLDNKTLTAGVAKTMADVEYIAMMTDIDLEG